jgi:hypothetical protein
MYSWSWFYSSTRFFEHLLENALHRGIRKVHFVGQDRHTRVFKLAHPDLNNCITSVPFFWNLACLLISTQLSFFSIGDGFSDIGITLIPCQKQVRNSKTSPVSAHYPSSFTFVNPVNKNSLRFPAWVFLFLIRPMYINHWRASTDWRSPSRDLVLTIIPTVFGFRIIVRNNLLQMDDIVMWRKGSFWRILKTNS